MRLLVSKNHIVAEGAGATSLGAALSLGTSLVQEGEEADIVCVCYVNLNNSYSKMKNVRKNLNQKWNYLLRSDKNDIIN